MTARECASMLRNNRIFQSVGEDRLERLVENADMQTFRRGDEILLPSRGGRIMGMIITGSAAVNKGRAVINTLVPGDIFGAVTLFSDEPSPATTVTARVECSAVFFEKDAIAELIESEPGAAIGFAAYLSARIRFLTRRIEALTAGDSASKLLSYLLEREQDGEVDIQSCAELARRLDVGRASEAQLPAAARSQVSDIYKFEGAMHNEKIHKDSFPAAVPRDDFQLRGMHRKDRRQRNDHGRDCSGGHNADKYHDPQGSDRHGHG